MKEIHSPDAKLHHPSEATGTQLAIDSQGQCWSTELMLLPRALETSSGGLSP